MRHIRPDDLPTIKRHVGIDMTPREMARWLDVPEAEVMHGGFQVGANVHTTPTRFFTPRTAIAEHIIGSGIRLAKRSDEYEPYFAAEWQAHLAAMDVVQ